MGLFSALFGGGGKSKVTVHRKKSKHDKIKEWAKTKDKSYWDSKKKK